jgi:hypothetical protein
MAFNVRRKARCIAIATCCAWLLPEMASAKDRSVDNRYIRSGKAGREIVVRGYMTWKHDCSFRAYPEVVLDEPPQHGVVCLQIGTMRAGLGYFGKTPHCVGRLVRGVRVVYLPRSDFVGMDKMYYTVLYPSGLRRTVRTIFSVSPADPGARGTVPADIAAPMPEVRQPSGRVPYCSALVS